MMITTNTDNTPTDTKGAVDRRLAYWREANANPLEMPTADPNRPAPRPRNRRTSVRHRSIR